MAQVILLLCSLVQEVSQARHFIPDLYMLEAEVSVYVKVAFTQSGAEGY